MVECDSDSSPQTWAYTAVWPPVPSSRERAPKHATSRMSQTHIEYDRASSIMPPPPSCCVCLPSYTKGLG